MSSSADGENEVRAQPVASGRAAKLLQLCFLNADLPVPQFCSQPGSIL